MCSFAGVICIAIVMTMGSMGNLDWEIIIARTVLAAKSLKTLGDQRIRKM
jgi:hypothetical protein